MGNGRCISATQLFWLVFAHVFGGLALYGGGSLLAALYLCSFSACAIVAADAMGRRSGSSALYRRRLSPAARIIIALLLCIPVSSDMLAFSADIASRYEGLSPYAALPLLAAICFYALQRDIVTAARFAESLVLPLAALLLLSLLRGGEGVSLGIPTEGLLRGGLALGSSAVFFSLYRLCPGEYGAPMSCFAKSSSFHPSPAACGVAGASAGAGAYLWLRFAGASGILAAFFTWFFCLARLFALGICAGDILALYETGNSLEKIRRAAAFLATCAAVWAFRGACPSEIFAAAMVGNAFAPWAAWSFALAYRKKKAMP